MTDRYILTQPEAIARRFQTRQGVTGKAQFNIWREMKVPTISRNSDGENEIIIRLFGFIPPGASGRELKASPIARSEKVHETRTFQAAFRTARCLAVADGCYVWEGRQPYLLRLKSRALFGIAAVNTHLNPPLQSFALLTTYPNELVAQVHRRMVVILRPEDEDAYLDPATPIEEVRRLLVPYDADEMEMYKVTQELNQAKPSSADFIRPLGELIESTNNTRQKHGQLSMFD